MCYYSGFQLVFVNDMWFVWLKYNFLVDSVCFLNRGASFRWSFGPLSAWRSIESTTILTTHPSLVYTIPSFKIFAHIPLWSIGWPRDFLKISIAVSGSNPCCSIKKRDTKYPVRFTPCEQWTPMALKNGLFLYQKWSGCYSKMNDLRQVSGIKFLNQMSTYHLACGDIEIT